MWYYVQPRHTKSGMKRRLKVDKASITQQQKK